MPVFTNPWAFLGLLLPLAIAGIYIFRNRSRPQVVSSLLLWSNQRKPSEGGLVFQGPQAPLLLILEVLAVILIVLAAAQPQALSSRTGIPVIIVLDNSFSMIAGAEVSPRQKALQALTAEFAGSSQNQLRFVVCGRDSEFLGPPVNTWAEATDQLQNWRCSSPGSNLAEGIMFAKMAVKGRGRIRLITDHAPPESFSGKEVQWWAFGTPLPNVAITNATRTRFGSRDRVLLEISNFTSTRKSVTGRLQAVGNGLLRNSWELDISPGDTRQLFFDLPDGTTAVQGIVNTEDLALDNVVTLLGDQQQRVKTRIAIKQPALAALVKEAVKATQKAVVTQTDPDLYLTDSADTRPFQAGCWEVTFHQGTAPRGLIGPFAVDAEHPLSAGLAADGLIWGVGSGTQLPGEPVLLAGNRPLISVEKALQGNRRIHLDIVPQASTVHRSPMWPILFWNLIDWRQKTKPGPVNPNIRLGGHIRVMAPHEATEITVTFPDNTTENLPVIDRQAVIEGQQVGLYQIHGQDAAAGSFTASVNALSHEESDLRKATSVQIGEWEGSTFFQQTARDMK